MSSAAGREEPDPEFEKKWQEFFGPGRHPVDVQGRRPLAAYRCWGLAFPRMPWGHRTLHATAAPATWRGRRLEAVCLEQVPPPHPAPDAGCRCGIYAWESLQTARRYARRRYGRRGWRAWPAGQRVVYGAVRMWGPTVIEEVQGQPLASQIRARHAEIVALLDDGSTAVRSLARDLGVLVMAEPLLRSHMEDLGCEHVEPPPPPTSPPSRKRWLRARAAARRLREGLEARKLRWRAGAARTWFRQALECRPALPGPEWVGLGFAVLRVGGLLSAHVLRLALTTGWMLASAAIRLWVALLLRGGPLGLILGAALPLLVLGAPTPWRSIASFVAGGAWCLMLLVGTLPGRRGRGGLIQRDLFAAGAMITIGFLLVGALTSSALFQHLPSRPANVQHPPMQSTRPKPSSSPPAPSLPAAFVGKWSGTWDDPTDPFQTDRPVQVALEGGTVGQVVGTMTYPESHEVDSLTLRAVRGDSIELTEQTANDMWEGTDDDVATVSGSTLSVRLVTSNQGWGCQSWAAPCMDTLTRTPPASAA